MSACLFGVEPGHIGSRRALYALLHAPLSQAVVLPIAALIGLIRKLRSLQKLLSQIVVPLPGTLIGTATLRSQLKRHRNSSVENPGKKVAIGSGCKVEKDPLVAHLL